KERLSDTALRLNSAYAQSGETAKGIAFLDDWCRSNPTDVATLRVLADSRLRAGDVAGARSAYERLLRSTPQDVAVLNNLAQVAIRQGDKRAVDYAEQAYNYANQNPAVIDTLGWA